MSKQTLRWGIFCVALAATAGCQNLPANLGPILSTIGSGTSGAPSISGSVNKPQANERVGLLAQPQAGGSHLELASASASTGSYSIVMNDPSYEMLQQPAEDKSYIFLLTPYVDINGNGRFDDGIDRILDANGASFRWFAAAGPSYAEGWNVYDPSTGTYTQSFSTAYNL